ncbi:hypothetical protein [Catellatospora methionotrophica]|nr:hypothetical protein [Catellatospora methionotrophica]
MQGIVKGTIVKIAAGLCAAAMLLIGAPAFGAPTPSPKPSPSPTVRSITISSDTLGAPIVLRSDSHQRPFTAMAGEVDWLAGGTSTLKGLPADKLGPKFTVLSAVNGVDKQTYDLYPLAAGGPRVFRPAAQPDKRKVTAAWFLGRFTMDASLRGAGVLLGTAPPAEGGGVGGGLVESATAEPDIRAMVGDWQRFVGLNGAVVVVIALGVFAIAYAFRRTI